MCYHYVADARGRKFCSSGMGKLITYDGKFLNHQGKKGSMLINILINNVPVTTALCNVSFFYQTALCNVSFFYQTQSQMYGYYKLTL
jgi:hypothetical protein